MVQRFRAAHPGIQLKLLGLPIAAVLRSVAEGDADLALAYDVPGTAGFRTLFSSDWQIGAVVPPGHPLTAHATALLAECVGYPLILPAPSLSIRPILDAAFERSAIRVSPVVETTSTALMRRLVRDGGGITLLNRLDVDEERNDGSLVFVPLRDTTLRAQTLTLETRAAQAPSAAAELFANHVVACLDDLLAP
ncbi:pca operon transcription factor PcaQ [compost metagenome]